MKLANETNHEIHVVASDWRRWPVPPWVTVKYRDWRLWLLTLTAQQRQLATWRAPPQSLS